MSRSISAAITMLLLASPGCRTIPQTTGEAPFERYEKVCALTDKGEYQAAMRLLPEAMREWERHTRETGKSHEGAAGFLYGHVMDAVASKGDAYWGRILDDPEIPYVYKTEMVFEILEIRLGKGAVYVGNESNFIVPRKGLIDLDKEMIKLQDQAR